MSAILVQALRAHARGLPCTEAATELILSQESFLHRPDFRDRFIRLDVSSVDGTPLAEIGWRAAITALNLGEIPCSAGEQRKLRLAASMAASVPVDLRDTLTGLDATNTSLVIAAILRASGHQRSQ